MPQSVMQQAAAAVINWNDSGLSILEVSHRSSEFESVMSRTKLLVKELLKVPDDYSILFLQGGASTQFSMIPQSFLRTKGLYLDSGFFAQKAIKEAHFFGDAEVIASSADKNYNYIPDIQKRITNADYLHITSNNTIEGTEIFNWPEIAVPLVCDMSSDIFSREIRVRDFDLIYAGAQKNMGPAGATLIIVKNKFLDSVDKQLPSMADYRIYRDHNSLYNTPPVFSIYTSMLNLLWLKNSGGVPAMEKQNIKKSMTLYAEIDRNTLFTGNAAVAHRSRMNVTFKTNDPAHEMEFLDFAASRGMVGIKGYRTVGGFRASLYNALPLESVLALVTTMQDFEKLKQSKQVISEKTEMVINTKI